MAFRLFSTLKSLLDVNWSAISDGQFLKRDGDTITGGTPGGGGGAPGGSANGQIQYKSGTAFGASASLTYDDTSKLLTVGGGEATDDGRINTAVLEHQGAGDWAGVAFKAKATLYNRDWVIIGNTGTPSWPQGLGESPFGITVSGMWDIQYSGSRITFGVLGACDVELNRIGSSVLQLNARSSTVGAVFEFLPVASGGTPSADGARIYSKLVSGNAELFAMDEAGNETQLSPHAMDAPASLYDQDEAFPQVSKEANYFLGVVRYVNHTRLRDGRSDWEHRETFQAHNTRTGNALAVVDWDARQSALVAKRNAEIQAWNQKHTQYLQDLARYEADKAALLAKNPQADVAPPPTFGESQPAPYAAKPKPQWLENAQDRQAAFTARRDAKVARRQSAYQDLKADVESLLGITINSPDELEEKAGQLLAIANQKRDQIDAQGSTLAITRQALALERRITNLFFRFTVFLARR